VLDIRKALEPEDIVVSDVGAHKMWMARMYQAESPNTCILSNGFASMGIGVPGAVAAKLAYPDRTALTRFSMIRTRVKIANSGFSTSLSR